MPSPYICRLRLGRELRRLREEHNLTAGDVARLTFQSRSKISKMENAQVRPDLADVLKILEVFEVTGREWDRLFHLARDAAEKGWWDRYGISTGHRERLFASLEAGAASISVYSQTNFPAILQTPEFTSALIDLDRNQGPLGYRPERMANARVQRQEHLLRPDGPRCETVLEDSILYRLNVPPAVMIAQIRHLLKVMSDHPRITLRVLPHDVLIPGGLLPQASFFLFTFPTPDDLPVAVVDTATTDLVLTESHDVDRYMKQYDRLRAAALSPLDSTAFLKQVLARLTEQAGSGR
ncbi:helix-turn-helix domain-containing protein [Thermomonospora cellulosilytica]|uniref:Transcriptional regulator with XRE-family HTH domain n=1 Tax=Thermomonospora cellulosilytica TaxID=1411118 RepID=A0A7W3MZM6_9ACTN|nr:helix-turn-helix transcriptional regulator [Thermomonospora cellulosilytica]MBA9004840.1 transcriptional regulator with XRE-family HTH domain [Thermomonospora cellulosilytica]